MGSHKEITEQLKLLEFDLIRGPKFTSPTGAYFIHLPSRGKMVEKYVTVRSLARVNQYSLMFGFNCPELRKFYAESELIESRVADEIRKLNAERPYCWSRTSIRSDCRSDTWSCPAQSDEMKAAFSTRLKKFFLDFLASIETKDALLQIYLMDGEPYEWMFGTSYFARMCEIAYLVADAKYGSVEADLLVERYYSPMTKSDLFGSTLDRGFFKRLVKTIEIELGAV
jgi:hypothetical protein